MSVPARVIDPDDAKRCAAALQRVLRRWPKDLDIGDLQQIQAVFQVAGWTGQTLQLGPLESRMSHFTTAGHDLGRDDFLSIDQAAEVERVHRRTIERRLESGDIEAVRVGGQRLIRRNDLRRS